MLSKSETKRVRWLKTHKCKETKDHLLVLKKNDNILP